MEKNIKIALAKFFIITAAVFAYVFIMAWVVSPYLVQQVYGQSAFDTPNQFNPDPYNQQYGQQYQQQYGYDQYNQQYQQPYQQYGTPYQQPYMQQPYYNQIPPAQSPIQFGTSEVIYTLLGGGAIGYARYNQHKRNQDKELQRDLYAELLKEKQEKRELARVSYQHMPQQGNEITDAPKIQLQKLDQDIDSFADKVAKA